jgi:hypothetical protein
MLDSAGKQRFNAGMQKLTLPLVQAKAFFYGFYFAPAVAGLSTH